jgi:hypothetical protein
VSFALVYGDHDLALPLPFDAHIEEKLVLLMDADSKADSTGKSTGDLASRIVEAITLMLEVNVTPPSEKQVKYAIAVARELNLNIPAAVLQSRDVMRDFLDANGEAYRRSLSQKRSPSANAAFGSS